MKNNHTETSSRKLVYLILALVCAGLAIAYIQFRPKNSSSDTEIVVVLPLSGKGASHGEFVREGLRMYAKNHPDSKLNVTIVDSESDPKKAVSGFQQQIQFKKPAAAITVLSAVSDAVAPLAQEQGILLIGVNTSTENFVKKQTVTQRINDRPSDHTAPIARMAAKKFKKVGVIYSNDAFGQFCKTTFEAAYGRTDPESLATEPFTPTEQDHNLVVQRLLDRKPDAVFVAGYGPGYLTIFQVLRTFKYSGPIFADINFSNPSVLASLGEAADGVVFAAIDFNVSPPSTQKAKDFLDAYVGEFKREPWLGSAFAYDSLAVLDHLISTKQPLERKSIFTLKEFPGIAAPLSFPTEGECQYVFQFVRRESGKNVPVELDKLNP